MYRVYEEDNDQYVQALAESDLVERARDCGSGRI